MNIVKQLEALNAKRKALIASLETLTTTCEEESRTFTQDEQVNFDSHSTEVKAIDEQITRMNAMLKMAGETAAPVTASAVPGEPGVGTSMPRIDMKPREKGTVFTRYVMALAASKGDLMQAVEMSKRWRDSTPEVETILRGAVVAGTTTDADWALELAPYTTAAAEFIELLRPETLIGRMTGFRKVPFMTRIPKQTSGATAGWVGEGLPKPMSEMVFDAITIPHTKVAVIVALTDELVRFSNPSAEATVRADLIAAIASYLDVQFIDPLVTVSSGVRPASITNGVTDIDSTGASLAQITHDLAEAMAAMAAANVPMRNRYWLLNPRTEIFLRTIRDGNGNFAFRDEMNAGRLFGVAFLSSTGIGISSLNTNIVLVEASEILLADDGMVTIDASREASLQFTTSPSSGAQSMVSLWQSNMVGLRAERYVYWLRRRAEAVQWISGVAY